MNKKTFFTRAASKALALAATVMMMSAAFTACSSSNDGPTTEPKVNTVTIDGVEKPILKAEYIHRVISSGDYILYLYLSDDHKEKVEFHLNTDLHMNGTTDLAKKESEDNEQFWSVDYYTSNGNHLIDTYGDPNDNNPVFTTGTLTVSGSPQGTINIKIENGRVKGTDGKEHTLVLSYSGTMERAGGPTPVEKYVDLGLPSGTKWARCNLGASKPTDYGDYFAWGETEPKTNYTWATYKWMQAGQSDWKHITKYTYADDLTEGIWYDADGNFIGDNKTTLEAADDAATAKLGSPWRMPTWDEIKELIDNCTWTWTTQDGVNGCEVKSKKNGNSIFLPAAGYRDRSEFNDAGSQGYYWSSALSTVYSYCACFLGFDSGSPGRFSGYRYAGRTVRPVHP